MSKPRYRVRVQLCPDGEWYVECRWFGDQSLTCVLWYALGESAQAAWLKLYDCHPITVRSTP